MTTKSMPLFSSLFQSFVNASTRSIFLVFLRNSGDKDMFSSFHCSQILASSFMIALILSLSGIEIGYCFAIASRRQEVNTSAFSQTEGFKEKKTENMFIESFISLWIIS